MLTASFFYFSPPPSAVHLRQLQRSCKQQRRIKPLITVPNASKEPHRSNAHLRLDLALQHKPIGGVRAFLVSLSALLSTSSSVVRHPDTNAMGKHYCDYCDVFLTHDSVSVRKAHNSGRNHLQNVREYYQNLDPDQIQQVLDTLAKEYDRRGIEKPRDLLQPAGSSFMTFGAGPLSGTSERGRCSSLCLLFKRFESSLLTAIRFALPHSFKSAFRSQGPPRMSMGGGGGGGGGPDRRAGPGQYGRYGNGGDSSSRDYAPPPNFNRAPPQSGPYSRPPPNMIGGGASGGSNGSSYPPRGPPPDYGGPPPAPYASGPPPNMRGPPPPLQTNGSYPPQQRSGYGPR